MNIKTYMRKSIKGIKILCVFLVMVVTVIGMGACDVNNLFQLNEAKETETPEDRVKKVVESRARVNFGFEFGNGKVEDKNVRVNVSCNSVTENDDGRYTVKGYVTVTDEYGDKYESKFDAIATEHSCYSFEAGTLTKVE